ncbi:MAG: hypothetical protein HQK60_20455 [Deltaproteobacteria bacterium]|nr:hypothetical protein [Deltaproteobacteria bacterium]
MLGKTIENVKGTELSAEWLIKQGFVPEETFTITIEPAPEDDENMPPEEAFRPEFIAEIERRDREAKQGNVISCRTKEEREAFFNSVWNDE